MRVVILGAGQVGGSLAQNLVNEDNDITLIDVDEERLQKLQHRLDIQTVIGSAAHPDTLLKAGIQQADMLIAVTSSDEVNMLGCFVAYNLFQTPSKIARIRSENYLEYPSLFTEKSIPVDVCIRPERLIKDHIVNLVRFPGITQILEFAAGKLLLMTFKINVEDSIYGKNIRQLARLLDDLQASVVAVFRNKKSLSITDDFVFMQRDVISFIVAASDMQKVLIALNRFAKPNKRIIIAGGGHIGARLAKDLENDYQVKVIEHNHKSAERLAEKLNKAMVLDGDIADKDLLLNENIEFTDVFCALTNDDEANIMASLQAKNLGVKHTMALVNRDAYVDLIDDSSIDYAISPQQITIGSILTKLRRGNMVNVYKLQYDEAEAIELIIHGSERTSRVIGRRISEIDLPPSCLIIAVVRGSNVYITNPDFTLANEDHVILLLLKRRFIRHVESLFQVNLSFMS